MKGTLELLAWITSEERRLARQSGLKIFLVDLGNSGNLPLDRGHPGGQWVFGRPSQSTSRPVNRPGFPGELVT
jgi:hypothetical protein